MTDREAMQNAKDALLWFDRRAIHFGMDGFKFAREAIAGLDEALARGDALQELADQGQAMGEYATDSDVIAEPVPARVSGDVRDSDVIAAQGEQI